MVGGKLATPSNLFDWHIRYLGIYPFHVYAPNHLFYYQHTAQLLRHKIFQVFAPREHHAAQIYKWNLPKRSIQKVDISTPISPPSEKCVACGWEMENSARFFCHLSAYLLNYSHKLFRACGKLYPWSCVKNWWDSAKGFQNYGSLNWKGYGYPQVLATPGSETIWDPKTF